MVYYLCSIRQWMLWLDYAFESLKLFAFVCTNIFSFEFSGHCLVYAMESLWYDCMTS